MLGALALLVGLLETWTGKIKGDKTGGYIGSAALFLVSDLG
jgi:hypothetical protein